jgi:hypothetical protein
MIKALPQFDASTMSAWIGEIILQTNTPIVLSEISFLELKGRRQAQDSDDDVRDFIGKIDDVLVHPTRNPMDWCALEVVHFSGKAMEQEFKSFDAKKHQALTFPGAQRRPDWRSSVPERLLRRLQTKVPTIRTWGKKMAVLVDEAFFGSLVELEPEKYLSNSEIAWFVVGYDENRAGWVSTPRKVVFATLKASVKALTGGVPLSRGKFEEQLSLKLAAKFPGHPLAKQN